MKPIEERIIHHGGKHTVTGSCHELRLNQIGILVDCGLLQGADAFRIDIESVFTDQSNTSDGNGTPESTPQAKAQEPPHPNPVIATQINFPIDHIRAMVITHVHIDHVGRLPYLLAAGFTGPIICSQASAKLLPLVIEDAIKVGGIAEAILGWDDQTAPDNDTLPINVPEEDHQDHQTHQEQLDPSQPNQPTKDQINQFIQSMIQRVQDQILPLDWKQKFQVPLGNRRTAWISLKQAGHILGSAYVTVGVGRRRIVFSGDLGAPYTPLIPSPQSPYKVDRLVLESTYGDRLHPDRRNRRQALKAVLEHAFSNGGIVLIPAFSLGRTQELLYELEGIIHQHQKRKTQTADSPTQETQTPPKTTEQLDWSNLDIIVDSPLAAKFTQVFREVKPLWDAEARRRVHHGRHPLSFDQIITIENHVAHQQAVKYYTRTGKPAIVIAAAGMCTGGRIVNWLKATLGDPKNDIIFAGYQASGTPGRAILDYGPGGPRAPRHRPGYVVLDRTRYPIRASVHRLSSYSAHADQAGLLRFVTRMRHKPTHIHLVHGESTAQTALAEVLTQALPGVCVE
jgi:metallo-beta-lactamase family protein